MFNLLAYLLLSLVSYSQVIPEVEIRINNTASAKDDYVNTAYIPCNIRLINGASFTSNVAVTLRNIPSAPAGQVLFSSTGSGTGVATLNLTLNRNNSASVFFIRNSTGFNSVRDKDAIIEVIDARVSSNPAVLGRKGLMVVTTSPLPNSLPQIELQINNSGSTLDDYVTWSPTLCRARLVNSSSFSAPVAITLRNMTGATGLVNFASNTLAYNSTATNTTLNLTLPNTGTWVNFYVAGRYGNPSVRDKDAIIEIIKAGTQTTIVSDTISGGGGGTPVTQIVRDTVVTVRDTLITSTSVRTTLAVNDSVNRISVRGTVVRVRDTVITETTHVVNSGGTGPVITQTSVTINDGTILTREPLMVRVRKNANNILVEERNRYLNALSTLNNTFNGYAVFNDIHMEAANPEAHNGPGFLAWHRAFVLSFERRLQAVDPSVSVPYWRFDVAAANVFSRDFMGTKPTSTSVAFVGLNSTNPMVAWNVTGGPGIRRTTSFANNQNPPEMKSSWINETATLALGTTYSAFTGMEANPHNHAHNQTGSLTGDWIKVVGTSLRDPIFFLIHGNVDRLWARWQWINNRFDATTAASYSPQGSFPNSGTIHIGHYLNDTMWPWNGVTGTYNGTGTVLINNRPTTAPGGPIPDALSLASPVSIPRPLNLVDYKNNRSVSTVNSGMGFCYDDVPFQ